MRRGAWSGVCSAMCADVLKFLYASVFFIRKNLDRYLCLWIKKFYHVSLLNKTDES